MTSGKSTVPMRLCPVGSSSFTLCLLTQSVVVMFSESCSYHRSCLGPENADFDGNLISCAGCNQFLPSLQVCCIIKGRGGRPVPSYNHFVPSIKLIYSTSFPLCMPLWVLILRSHLSFILPSQNHRYWHFCSCRVVAICMCQRLGIYVIVN